MLGRIRRINCAAGRSFETPLLIPSFSSKGFPQVKAMLDIFREQITDTVLLSAYDMHYAHVGMNNNFAALMIIDSGGYEASTDADLSDARNIQYRGESWTRVFYSKTFHDLKIPRETTCVAVSYDNPARRLPLEGQLQRADEDLSRLASRGFVPEVLIKAEPGALKLNIDEICRRAADLKRYPIVGFTEKELGSSILERMVNITRLRKSLGDSADGAPIHVFGALDPIAVPLYFVAGADIFDGLTWLRYAYRDGAATYMFNNSPYAHGIDVSDDKVRTRTWVANLGYLDQLQREMKTFARHGDVSVFSHNQELLKSSIAHWAAEVGD